MQLLWETMNFNEYSLIQLAHIVYWHEQKSPSNISPSPHKFQNLNWTLLVAFVGNMPFIYSLCSDNLFAQLIFLSPMYYIQSHTQHFHTVHCFCSFHLKLPLSLSFLPWYIILLWRRWKAGDHCQKRPVSSLEKRKKWRIVVIE